MNQEAFVTRGETRWREFSQLLDQCERKKGTAPADFPARYRDLCHDLAIARDRQLDAPLVDRLNDLALRGHRQLYKTPAGSWQRIVDFWIDGFPRAVQKNTRFVVIATVLFYGSSLLVAGAVYAAPDLIFSILNPNQVAMIEAMYDPKSDHLLRPRGHDTDAAMFGFYIRNNMGVGFRTFAGGIFAGLGSLFFLLFNGVFLGAVGGHLVRIGYGVTFSSFVIGHGAFELQAVVLAAAAGLKLGWPLLAPGNLSRLDALRVSARGTVPLVYGSTGMLFVAACLEAFWSSSVLIPATVKYGVGSVLWLLVLTYLAWPRRSHGS